jgi:RNA polymerase sigma factor (sigma-70 family)
MPGSQRRWEAVTDEALVVRSLLGDLPAFDEIVRRFRPAVLLITQQALGSRAAAEDAAQEAFLRAFKALPQLAEPAKFAGWLCAIARHHARRVAARESRAAPAEPSEIDRLLVAHSRELAAGCPPARSPAARTTRGSTRRSPRLRKTTGPCCSFTTSRTGRSRGSRTSCHSPTPR